MRGKLPVVKTTKKRWDAPPLTFIVLCATKCGSLRYVRARPVPGLHINRHSTLLASCRDTVGPGPGEVIMYSECVRARMHVVVSYCG